MHKTLALSLTLLLSSVAFAADMGNQSFQDTPSAVTRADFPVVTSESDCEDIIPPLQRPNIPSINIQLPILTLPSKMATTMEQAYLMRDNGRLITNYINALENTDQDTPEAHKDFIVWLNANRSAIVMTTYPSAFGIHETYCGKYEFLKSHIDLLDEKTTISFAAQTREIIEIVHGFDAAMKKTCEWLSPYREYLHKSKLKRSEDL